MNECPQEAMITDACVPLSRLPDLIAEVRLACVTVGHSPPPPSPPSRLLRVLDA